MDQEDHQLLPVFVQPSEINFIIGKPESHKAMLTIFNPYQFRIRFRVLCNAPSKYTIGLTRGTIRPGCYLDTTIRHKSPVDIESNRLRIEIFKLNEELSCGQKEIPLNVLYTQNAQMDSRQLMEFDEESFSAKAVRSRIIPNFSRNNREMLHELRPTNAPNFYWLAVLSFLFCISVLLLPQYIERDTNKDQMNQYSWIPQWLRPTSTSKCISAYVLGILTVYFFLQPTA